MNLKRTWPVAVVLAAVGWFYWDFLWGRTFIWGDALTEYFPGLHYFTTSVRSGRWPMWIAEVRNGMPFYTDIQLAIFYPPTWLLVWPASAERLPFTAYQVFLVAHIAWGGLGMLWFLRGLGLQPVAGAVGAVTFCLAAFMSLHMVHAVMLQVYVWWPWLLEWVRRVATTRARRAWGGLLVVGAMMFLAGHPQTTLYGLYLGTAYWVYVARSSEKWWRSLAWATAAWTLTMLLLGPVLLPVAENWYLSGRTESTLETTAEGSAPLTNLIGLVAPLFFGTLQAAPSRVIFWGDAPGGTTPVAPWNYWEFGWYVGQFGVMAVAVLAFNRQRPAGFFLAAFAVAVWFGLGRNGGLFQAAYYLVPGVALFRVPARAGSVICFCGAVLAALCVERLSRQEAVRWRAPALLVVAVHVVVIALWRSKAFPSLDRAVVFEWAGEAVLRAVGMALAVGACGCGLTRSGWCRRLAGAGLVLLCVGDFWLAYGRYHRGQVRPDEYFADVDGIIETVRARSASEGPSRVAQFRGSRLAEEVLFPLNIGFVQRGFETPDGYTSFCLRQTGALMMLTNTAARLAVQNVRITARLDEATGRVVLAPYPAGLPRARFYSRVQTYRSDEEVLAALDAGRLDYRQEIGVVADSWPVQEASGEVRFVAVSPEEYELHYQVTGPGIIFVSITDYPGWRSEFEKVRVFGAFQGYVIRQAGEGVVRVRFEPRVWRWGLLLTVAGAVGWVVIISSYPTHRR